jgi:hypothetical protein
MYNLLYNECHSCNYAETSRINCGKYEIVALLGCYATSIGSYESVLRNISEELKSHLHRGGSLK